MTSFVTFNLDSDPKPPLDELAKLNLETEELPIQNPGGPVFRGIKFTIPEDRYGAFDSVMEESWGEDWWLDSWSGIE